jgi:hypothetical protein
MARCAECIVSLSLSETSKLIGVETVISLLGVLGYGQGLYNAFHITLLGYRSSSPSRMCWKIIRTILFNITITSSFYILLCFIHVASKVKSASRTGRKS